MFEATHYFHTANVGATYRSMLQNSPRSGRMPTCSSRRGFGLLVHIWRMASLLRRAGDESRPALRVRALTSEAGGRRRHEVPFNTQTRHAGPKPYTLHSSAPQAFQYLGGRFTRTLRPLLNPSMATSFLTKGLPSRIL